MMRTPPTRFSHTVLLPTACERAPREEPSKTKTMVKPTMNVAVLRTVARRRALTLLPESAERVKPARYVRKAGTRARVQGARNEVTPAAKATIRLTELVSMSYSRPTVRM